MIYSKLLCPDHGYCYVSMPRMDLLDSPHAMDFVAKCPLAKCRQGIKRQMSVAEKLDALAGNGPQSSLSKENVSNPPTVNQNNKGGQNAR